MKASKYNFFVEYDEGILAYNCLGGTFLKMDRRSYDLYRRIVDAGSVSEPKNSETEKLVCELRRGRFIVEDGFDELEYVKARHFLSRFNSKYLSLTIAPTLDCNFNCVYCFEGTRKKGIMSRQIQDGIIDYVAAHIKTLSHIHVSWFGGEPTLVPDLIYSLSERLIALAEKNGTMYTATLISNAYLLTREMAERMRSHGVSTVQLTVDGPPEHHDRRRVLRNGGSTFDAIFRNVKEIAGILYVVFRVNIDTQNWESFPRLLNMLEEAGVSKSAVSIDIAQTQVFTAACQSVADYGFDTETFAKMMTELYPIVIEHGFQVRVLPKPNYGGCTATGTNCLLIIPNGEIYRCWNTIGDERERIGHILRPIKLHHNLTKWLAWTPFEEEKCRRCNILPLCMQSGCPYREIAVDGVVRSTNKCSPWRYNLEKILKLAYQQRVIAENREEDSS
nr:radical SAM protein [Desulfobacterales bacterium]